MTHTEVRWATGSATFPRSVADEFTVGTLTVGAVDDGYVLRTFAAGDWTEATVYGDDGHPLYVLTAGYGVVRDWRRR